MTVYRTRDGFLLEYKDGKWTDGDLVFESGTVGGNRQPVPVDENGEPLFGSIIEKTCPKCQGSMEMSDYCGVWVCDDCDDHEGLVRCYCGWSLSGNNGRSELEEMGEVIYPE